MPPPTKPIGRRKALSLVAATAATAATPPPQQPAPAGAPPDIEIPLVKSNSDTGTLFTQIQSVAAPIDYEDSFLNPRWKSFDEHRWVARKVIFDSFHYAPPEIKPEATILDRRDLPGTNTILEKLVFSTTRNFRVPAYFLRPKNASGPLPAIIDLHSHGGMFLYGKEKVIDFGNNHPSLTEYHKRNYESRPTATALAERGYAVLTIDAFGFGERRFIHDDDLTAPAGNDRNKLTAADIERLNVKCRQKESTIAKSLAYAGTSWPAIVAYDDIRTVDYLLTRKEIDPNRIGCVGVSMGGYRSLLLAGLDDRIRAACVVGFMSTTKPMIQRHMDTHSFVHFPPAIHATLDLPDIVALRAPRPLFVLQCKRDGLFPLTGMHESVEKIAAIYRKAGSPTAFASKFYDVPHIFNIAMQNDAFAFLDAHLKTAPA